MKVTHTGHPLSSIPEFGMQIPFYYVQYKCFITELDDMVHQQW